MGEGKFTLSFIQNVSESADIGKTPGPQLFSCFHFQERKKLTVFVYLSFCSIFHPQPEIFVNFWYIAKFLYDILKIVRAF